MRILWISVILLVIFSLAAAADLSTDIAAMSKELVGKELPGAVGSLFGNEKINIYITQESGVDFVVGLVTKDKKVSSLAQGAVADPSLNVYTTTAVLQSIQLAADPGKALLDAFKQDQITYKAVGFKNKIKFAFTSLFAKVAGLFTKGNSDTEDSEDKAAEKEITEEQKQETKEVKEEDKLEKKEDKADDSTTTNSTEPTLVGPLKYTVKLEKDGFNPATLTIKKGDQVEWKIARTGYVHLGMILGTQNCADIKSSILENGNSFIWTFNEIETCTIVDGITTTQVSKVIVE